MNPKIIILAILAAMIAPVTGIEIRGDYAGDGDFQIRSGLGGQAVAAGGRNASMAYGQILTDSGAFAGLDMDGESGSFRMIGNFGLSHLAQVSGASAIAARTRVAGNVSIYALQGVGTYRERIIQTIGCRGKPAYLAEVDMVGSFDVNSSATADKIPPELLIEEV